MRRLVIPISILSIFLCLCLCLPAVLLPQPTLAANDAVNEKPIWLVVTRPIFLEAIKPLEDKRIKDGFKAIVSTLPVAEAIATLKRRPAFLLLVGDEQPGEEKQPWYVPSRTRKLYRWRATQEREFAADALLGDLDGDLVPDIPVGRIPVRTARQFKLIVNKILTFENKQPTLDDLRLPIWAGSSGYNPVFDIMATLLLLDSVQKNASLWVRPWIISADPMHPLCGWPPDQSATFTKQLERGALMAILMGHASATSFHSMTFNSSDISYSAEDARAALVGDKPTPAMVIIACSTGNFTGPENCLAESLLLIPAGPVAVIAATTESHPLTNYFSGLCLLQQGAQKNKRLGSIWLAAQQKAMKARDFIMERMLVNIEGKLEEKMNVANLRRDQILMYALLGDPATRLYMPDQLHASIKYSAGAWHWDVPKPQGATKLYVSFRPGGQSFPKVGAQLEKTTAHRLFQQANDTFAFKPLREFAADETWKGATNKAGTLRLVATGPGQICAIAFKLKSFDEEVTVGAKSRVEADPLADPNAVKASIKAFEGLEKALTQVDRRSRFEVREWLQTRVDNRIKLAKAVEMQVKIEISFIRKVAVEEKAKKTTKEIDDLLLKRQERLKTLVKTMEGETRRTRLPQRGSREIGGQRRSRPSAEERRRAWEERRSGGRLPGEGIREQGGFGGTGVESPAIAPEIAPAGVGGKNEIQASEWLKTGVENRISLAKAVQEPIKAVLIYIRKFAVEEGAKKTTAAIDGLLLSRQKRMERLVQRMEEQLKRMRFLEQGTRRIRGPRRSTLGREERRSGGLTPTEGTGGQEAPVEEENRRRRR